MESIMKPYNVYYNAKCQLPPDKHFAPEITQTFFKKFLWISYVYSLAVS